MIIRGVKPEDIDTWSRMRSELWPGCDEDHELEKYFDAGSDYITEVYFAEIDCQVAGFIELNIRNFAEGSQETRVPYVEGWYVRQGFRGRGGGSALMRKAESWALEQGFSELASDTDESNTDSIRKHLKLGFDEAARVVCFLKKLDGKN